MEREHVASTATAAIVRSARVLFDYAARATNQISIKQNTVINIVDYRGPGGWSKGEEIGTSKIGFFPSDYVKMNEMPVVGTATMGGSAGIAAAILNSGNNNSMATSTIATRTTTNTTNTAATNNSKTQESALQTFEVERPAASTSSASLQSTTSTSNLALSSMSVDVKATAMVSSTDTTSVLGNSSHANNSIDSTATALGNSSVASNSIDCNSNSINTESISASLTVVNESETNNPFVLYDTIYASESVNNDFTRTSYNEMIVNNSSNNDNNDNNNDNNNNNSNNVVDNNYNNNNNNNDVDKNSNGITISNNSSSSNDNSNTDSSSTGSSSSSSSSSMTLPAAVTITDPENTLRQNHSPNFVKFSTLIKPEGATSFTDELGSELMNDEGLGTDGIEFDDAQRAKGADGLAGVERGGVDPAIVTDDGVEALQLSASTRKDDDDDSNDNNNYKNDNNNNNNNNNNNSNNNNNNNNNEIVYHYYDINGPFVLWNDYLEEEYNRMMVLEADDFNGEMESTNISFLQSLKDSKLLEICEVSKFQVNLQKLANLTSKAFDTDKIRYVVNLQSVPLNENTNINSSLERRRDVCMYSLYQVQIMESLILKRQREVRKLQKEISKCSNTTDLNSSGNNNKIINNTGNKSKNNNDNNADVSPTNGVDYFVAHYEKERYSPQNLLRNERDISLKTSSFRKSTNATNIFDETNNPSLVRKLVKKAIFDDIKSKRVIKDSTTMHMVFSDTDKAIARRGRSPSPDRSSKSPIKDKNLSIFSGSPAPSATSPNVNSPNATFGEGKSPLEKSPSPEGTDHHHRPRSNRGICGNDLVPGLDSPMSPSLRRSVFMNNQYPLSHLREMYDKLGMGSFDNLNRPTTNNATQANGANLSSKLLEKKSRKVGAVSGGVEGGIRSYTQEHAASLRSRLVDCLADSDHFRLKGLIAKKMKRMQESQQTDTDRNRSVSPSSKHSPLLSNLDLNRYAEDDSKGKQHNNEYNSVKFGENKLSSSNSVPEYGSYNNHMITGGAIYSGSGDMNDSGNRAAISSDLILLAMGPAESFLEGDYDESNAILNSSPSPTASLMDRKSPPSFNANGNRLTSDNINSKLLLAASKSDSSPASLQYIDHLTMSKKNTDINVEDIDINTKHNLTFRETKANKMRRASIAKKSEDFETAPEFKPLPPVAPYHSPVLGLTTRNLNKLRGGQFHNPSSYSHVFDEINSEPEEANYAADITANNDASNIPISSSVPFVTSEKYVNDYSSGNENNQHNEHVSSLSQIFQAPVSLSIDAVITDLLHGDRKAELYGESSSPRSQSPAAISAKKAPKVVVHDAPATIIPQGQAKTNPNNAISTFTPYSAGGRFAPSKSPVPIPSNAHHHLNQAVIGGEKSPSSAIKKLKAATNATIFTNKVSHAPSQSQQSTVLPFPPPPPPSSSTSPLSREQSNAGGKISQISSPISPNASSSKSFRASILTVKPTDGSMVKLWDKAYQ